MRNNAFLIIAHPKLRSCLYHRKSAPTLLVNCIKIHTFACSISHSKAGWKCWIISPSIGISMYIDMRQSIQLCPKHTAYHSHSKHHIKSLTILLIQVHFVTCWRSSNVGCIYFHNPHHIIWPQLHNALLLLTTCALLIFRVTGKKLQLYVTTIWYLVLPVRNYNCMLRQYDIWC